ncbi:coiled-coil domain-containing protein 43 [Condylostylus longicornis]|uniref:coiled-coil domain-containing protein 43 n=1 Tax=Condylostylus longicornis TaxID=2530218 RepID=UPI00244E1886|nr:coiled-coil domain-containing protein 43 [Condylostylus longicornis]
MMDDFKEWLISKLKPLEIDESVFGEYIIGILEDNDNENEKVESLEGILPEMSELIKEIVLKWNDFNVDVNKKTEQSDSKEIDIVKDMADILEKKLATSAAVKTYTDDEKRIREQILQIYSQTDVPEHDEDCLDACDDGDAGLEKNTNFLDVQLAQKARREAAKAESLKKKEKDKEDREKQKQLREQKKEKRKTVKQERRK